MQVNGVNSFSNAQTFRGEEGKKINKKAIAAGVVAAAAVATTVAAGLHGKKIAGEQVTEEAGKGIAKAIKYVKDGFKDAFGVINKHITDIREAIAEKFAKKAPEGFIPFNKFLTASSVLPEMPAKISIIF